MGDPDASTSGFSPTPVFRGLEHFFMLASMLAEARRPSEVLASRARPSRTSLMRLFRSRTPAAVAVGTVVVYFLLGTAWAFSSPMFGVPDEYSHAVKAAAVVRGDIRPTSATVGERVLAPSWLVSTGAIAACFAGRPDVTPACQPKMTESTSLTTQTTTAGRYPPVYYALFGWPTLVLAGQSAFYVQREMTVLLSALLLGLAAWSASAMPRSGRVLLALGVAITPMTLYFMGGVNPQAPEIAAAAGVWISGWALLQSRSRFGSGAIARLTVAACALALCRPLSVLWLALIAGSLLVGFARGSHWRMFRESLFAKICAGVVLAGCLAQAAWVESQGALAQWGAGVHMSTADAIGKSMSRQLTWLRQMVGVLGWNDTVLWPPVYFVWLAAVTCLVLTALLIGSRRERLALVLVIAASMVIPTVAEVATHEQSGFGWQGRYIYPLVVGVALMPGMIASRRFKSIPTGRSWDHATRNILVPLVGAAQFFAFASALKRYSAGASSGFPFGDYVITWAPPGGVWAWVFVMGLFCVLFAVWLRLVAASGNPGPEEKSPVIAVSTLGPITPPR